MGKITKIFLLIIILSSCALKKTRIKKTLVITKIETIQNNPDMIGYKIEIKNLSKSKKKILPMENYMNEDSIIKKEYYEVVHDTLILSAKKALLVGEIEVSHGSAALVYGRYLYLYPNAGFKESFYLKNEKSLSQVKYIIIHYENQTLHGKIAD